MKLRDVIFYVKDIKTSKEFYKNLGFEIVEDKEIFVAYKTDIPEVRFSLNLANHETKVPVKQVCSFNVENIHELYENHQSMGLNIVKELQAFGNGFTYEIRDIDGNKLIFMQED